LSPSDRFVVYCRSGVRSAQVCGFLRQQGYKEVYNLKGGIIDWYQNGHPIVTE
jgi:rhodanese-related sulfurtransferase